MLIVNGCRPFRAFTNWCLFIPELTLRANICRPFRACPDKALSVQISFGHKDDISYLNILSPQLF